MNEIGLKVVESQLNVTEADVTPAPENGSENEVDPLSMDSENVPSNQQETAVQNDKREENCDENAKEEPINEVQEQEVPSQSVDIEKEEPKEETPEIVNDVPVTAVIEEEKEDTGLKVEAKVEEDTTMKVEDELKVPKAEPMETEAEVVDVPEKMEKEKSSPPLNGDICKDEQTNKRRPSQDIDTESPLKKLCQEVEKTFPQHDAMISDYIQTATKSNVDEIQRHTEQLLSEIQTLRELAQKKEHEWNNILHLKKVKEEILLRLLRRKQVISFEKSADVNGAERTDLFDYLNQAKNLAIDKSDEISGLVIKPPGPVMNPMMQPQVMPVTSHFNPLTGLPPPYDKAHMQSMPKPVFPQMMMPGPMPGFPRDMNGQLPSSFGLPMGRQGPTKDVKSIIADYRQRNPEITPRRGRRMKSMVNPNMMNTPRPIAPKMDNMNNLGNINMLFNNLDMNQKAMLERLQQIQAGGLPNGLSFKDVLVQFANMQQNSSGLIPNRPVETMTNRPEHHIRPERPERRRPERQEEHNIPIKQVERMASSSPRLPPPPPYPEISLLPVSCSQETPSQSQQNSLLHGILTKSCGEITITPVQPAQPEPQPEKPEVVQLEEEESGASEESGGSGGGGGGGGAAAGGRLVIDEGGDDAPTCQGCRARTAKFVCAGCANQWYCSRDCQVAAWDDHSEMCSG